jgi:superfamily I DNA and/or RNA helicase
MGANDDVERNKLLDSTRVVLRTLNTAESASLKKIAQPKFDLLLLDEAGQCPESEFYIANEFPGVRHIVVVGVPRELPATVLNQGCQEAGYRESFLSHLMKYQPEKVHLLNTQYRMDPIIPRFSNESFYGNRIVSAQSGYHRARLPTKPLLFVVTLGTEKETKHCLSATNDAGCFESCQLFFNFRPNQYIITFLNVSPDYSFLTLWSPF